MAASQMGTALGLKIGSTTCVAVPADEAGPVGGVVVSGPYLDLTPDQEPSLAETAGAHRITGFVDRVGDPVALLGDDGAQYTGQDLYAAAMSALAAEADRWNADQIVVAIPNDWQAHAIEALRSAADDQALPPVTVVAEAVAAVAALESRRGPVDGVQVVYDLGGSALDVAVVTGGPDSRILGRPLRSEEVSGAQFDHLVLGHVLASVGATDAIDPFDPATVTALTELRARCAAAREALSVDTETVISIDLPGLRTEARLVRSELEELLRGPLTSSMSLIGEALHLAETDLARVSTIVLIGGGSATPLVSELVSSTLRLPVAVNADPTITSATGAATIAAASVSAAKAAAAQAQLASAAPAAASAELVPSASRAITPAPRTLVAEPKTLSRPKRIAVVVGVAAAIALLTAGGLSVGTALTDDNKPTAGSSESTAPAKSSSAPSTTAGAPGSAARNPDGTAGTSSTPGQPGTRSTSGATATTAGGAPPVAGQTGAAPAPNAPAAGTPAPAQPGGGGTSGGDTSGGGTGGGDTSGGGESTGGDTGGSGGGGTPADVGNGVGGVVGGVGDGVGGVVGGVGNGVGGLLGGVLG
ncbi:MAG: Hsp70 family protein [Gordonia sp.]|nr:Hsp70 family protein [Gordonia sp. (in: high G+C Gram-positive bacteria)]